jgi:hypothetical protein
MTPHARHRPLAALALVALIIAGCSNAPPEAGTASNSARASSAGATSTARKKALKFAQCMRDNGVSAFPDPDASGELTIDAIANGSSLDTNSAAFERAIGACKDLEPAGFTGHKRSAQQQGYALKFAQCIRDSGVEDFPDPTPDAPLVDTTRIPSTERGGGMSTLNAAMQKCGAAFGDKLGVKRP